MWRSTTRSSTAAAVVLALLSTFCFALEVSPNSPCASKCIDRNDGNPSWRNQSLTFNDMLPCYNWEYLDTNSTAAALKFRACQECQMTSGWRTTFEDGGKQYIEQDTTWFLFNNKGVIDWCLFGRFETEENPNITSSSIYQRCSDSCGRIRSSIDYKIKSDPGSFDFCAHNTNANFTADAEPCATCLYQYEDLTILGNVLTTVQDMCDQKPSKDYIVPANVSVYAAERIQLSTTSSSPSPTSSTLPTPPDSSNSGLSTGGIVGIVLGGVIAISWLILLLLKRRKNRVMASKTQNNEENIPTPGYQYNSVPRTDKDHYTYAAEAPSVQAPVEMGAVRGINELPAASTPPNTRHQDR